MGKKLEQLLEKRTFVSLSLELISLLFEHKKPTEVSQPLEFPRTSKELPPVIVGLDLESRNDFLPKALRDHLYSRCETPLDVVNVAQLQTGKQPTLVLVTAYSGGSRFADPGRVKQRVEAMRAKYEHVGLCVLRYSDKPSNVAGESAEDETIHPATNVGGQHFSIILQVFKNDLYSPSTINNSSLAELVQVLPKLSQRIAA